MHGRVDKRGLSFFVRAHRVTGPLERALVARIPELRGIRLATLPVPERAEETEGVERFVRRIITGPLPFTGSGMALPIALALELFGIGLVVFGAERSRTKRKKDDESKE